MRILFLIPRFYPCTGGGETYVLELGKRLVKKGHKVTVFTSNVSDKGPVASEDEYLGIRIKRFKVIGSKEFYHFSPSIKKELEKADVDIVHGGGFTYYGCDAAAKICKRRGIPFVITPFYHPSFTSQGARRLFRLAYDPLIGRRKLKLADKVIAMTNYEIGELSKYTNREKFVSIPVGIDFERLRDKSRINDFMKKFGLEGKKILLFVGRIKENKGIQFAISALMELDNQVCLVAAGPDGGYRKDLEKLAKGLNVQNRVIFTGVLSFNDHLSSAYNACDIFVYPSEYESFGIVSAEALACGKPVIGTNIGGTKDIVRNNEYGFLLGYGDKNGLAKAVSKLLSDSKLRNEMGKKGKEHAKKSYDWDAIVESIISIYGSLASKK